MNADAIKKADKAEPKGLVKTVRAGARGDGIRIVLDVGQPVKATAFDLAPTSDYGNRVVIDLAPASAAAIDPVTAVASVVSKSAAPVATPTVPGVGRLPDKPIIIAVDAGHGGEDPGALARSQERRVGKAGVSKCRSRGSLSPY